MKKKNIDIITGASGMIGSTLVNKLINDDNLLILGFDNFHTSKNNYLKKHKKKNNFQFFNIDLSKEIKLKKKEINLLKNNKIRNIWLLAANSDIKNGLKDFNIDYKNTYLTTINTINYLDKFINTDTKIIFTSSSAVYGEKKLLLKEYDNNLCPVSNYGVMKLYSEMFIKCFSEFKKIKSFVFRLPNVIGFNLTHGVIFDFYNKILKQKKILKVLGNGNQKKPYALAEEVVNALVNIPLRNKNKFDIINLGVNDNGVKVKYIAEQFKKVFKVKKISYQKKRTGWVGDIPNYKLSFNKAKKFKFQFRLNSKEAVNKVVNHIKNKPEFSGTNV